MGREDRSLRRYRYRTAALVGPWRESEARAARDAARAGQIIVDREDPLNFRWVVPGEIEQSMPNKARRPGRCQTG